MSKKSESTRANNEDAFDRILSDQEVEDAISDSTASNPEKSTPQTRRKPTIESLQVALQEAENKALRYQADLDNFRRRTVRENQDRLKFAALPMFTDLLEVVDNLERALEASASDATVSGLVDGVKMVAQQIHTAFEKHGCKRIEAVGRPFDPNMHEAVQMQASNQYESGVVMMEIRSGYELNGRVVRPSQVFVSTGAESADADPT